MREGIAGPPQTPTARKAYQTKLAVLRIEGELLTDHQRGGPGGVDALQERGLARAAERDEARGK